MTFAKWFTKHKEDIHGLTEDDWCEKAFEAGRAAGLQERAPVDMDPAAYHYSYFNSFGQIVWDVGFHVPEVAIEYHELVRASAMQQAVAAERDTADMEPVAQIIEQALQGHASTREAMKWAIQQAVAQERVKWSTLLDLKEIELKEAKRVMGQAREALQASVDVPCYGGHPRQEEAIAAIDKVLKP